MNQRPFSVSFTNGGDGYLWAVAGRLLFAQLLPVGYWAALTALAACERRKVVESGRSKRAGRGHYTETTMHNGTRA